MFNAADIASNMQSSGGARIPAGIHQDVKLTNLNLESDYIEIEFLDSLGRAQKDRIYFPDESRAEAKGEKDAKTVYKETVDVRTRRITQYLKVFYSIDELGRISGATFLEYAKSAAAALEARKSTATLNVKLIKTSDLKYSDFPYFPPYVEKFVPNQPSTLSFSPWELKNRMGEPEADNEETPGESTFKLY